MAWGTLKQVYTNRRSRYGNSPTSFLPEHSMISHTVGCGARSHWALCGCPEVKRQSSGVGTQTCSSDASSPDSDPKAMSCLGRFLSAVSDPSLLCIINCSIHNHIKSHFQYYHQATFSSLFSMPLPWKWVPGLLTLSLLLKHSRYPRGCGTSFRHMSFSTPEKCGICTYKSLISKR